MQRLILCIQTEILHHSQQIEKPNPPASFPPPPAPSYKEGEKEKLLFLEGGAGNLTPLSF
jgi:hypothetical protein